MKKFIVVAVFVFVALAFGQQGQGCYCARGHWETQPCYWDSQGDEVCPPQLWVCDEWRCPQNHKQGEVTPYLIQH